MNKIIYTVLIKKPMKNILVYPMPIQMALLIFFVWLLVIGSRSVIFVINMNISM